MSSQPSRCACCCKHHASTIKITTRSSQGAENRPLTCTNKKVGRVDGKVSGAETGGLTCGYARKRRSAACSARRSVLPITTAGDEGPGPQGAQRVAAQDPGTCVSVPLITPEHDTAAHNGSVPRMGSPRVPIGHTWEVEIPGSDRSSAARHHGLTERQR